MAKLKTLRPRLSTMKLRLESLPTPSVVERKRGRAGDRQRMRRLQAHGVECSRCGRLGAWKQAEASRGLPLLIVDHILPLALGGRDDDDNVRVVCEPCHKLLTDEQFGRRPPS